MYISYENFSACAGISHQKSNLIAMVREAMILGRELIVPHFRLHGKHNSGREIRTKLAEYYNLATVRSGGVLTKIHLDAPERLPSRLISCEDRHCAVTERHLVRDIQGVSLLRVPLARIHDGFNEKPVHIDIHPSLIEIAKRAAFAVPKDSVWVHVRRGDMLWKTASTTTPQNIATVVRRIAPSARSIYIATNESDLKYFNPLREAFDLVTFRDIPDLERLHAEDNYKLFLAEQALSDLLKIRISTFRVRAGQFAGFLSEKSGWQ